MVFRRLLGLKAADGIEREETENDWADDAAIRDGAEAIAGIPRVGAFAIVAGNEELAFWDDGVNFAGGVFFRSVGVGLTPVFVVDEPVWMLFVVDFHDAVFNGDALARKSNDALNDVLIGNVVWYGASHGVFDASSFVFGDLFLVFVHKNDNLPALWDIFLPQEVRPRNGGAIDDNAVAIF